MYRISKIENLQNTKIFRVNITSYKFDLHHIIMRSIVLVENAQTTSTIKKGHKYIYNNNFSKQYKYFIR